ncbi:hypothetical protein [Aphanothece hegewaldii]|uniref:hypothetical protein n=1 Tax=Aphanothece hegewaldii TaxID=1521625 RepID=UPI001C6397DD|nr:hypothetical protein [Aphanothece hegewaldii]
MGYIYDYVGNRLTKTESVEGVTTYIYDNNDRLLTETTNGVVTVYEYDDNGNTLSRQQGSEETVYEWNDENLLVKVIPADGQEVSYVYDADGIRVASTVDGVGTE